jgi:hypothetical protein
VIETFSHIFATVWTNFLNLNHAELFEFVRNTSPKSIRLHFSYFRDVSTEKMSAEQLKTVMAFCPDDGCIGEAAGVVGR